MKKILLSLFLITLTLSSNIVLAVDYDLDNIEFGDIVTDKGLDALLEGFNSRPTEEDPGIFDTTKKGGVSCGNGYCKLGYKCDKRFLAVLPSNDVDILGFFENLIKDIEEYTKSFISGGESDSAPNPVFKCVLVSPIDLSAYKMTPQDLLDGGLINNDFANFVLDQFPLVEQFSDLTFGLIDSVFGGTIVSSIFGKLLQDTSVSKYYSGTDPNTGRNLADLSKGVMDPGVPVNIINKEALPVEIFGNLPLPVTLSEPGPIDVKVLVDQQKQYDDVLKQQNKNTAYQSLKIGDASFSSLANSYMITNPYSILYVEPNLLSLTEMNNNVLSTLANQPDYSIEDLANIKNDYSKSISKIISPNLTLNLDNTLNTNSKIRAGLCPDPTVQTANCVYADLYDSKNVVATSIFYDDAERKDFLKNALEADRFATANPYLNKTTSNDAFTKSIEKPGQEIEDLKKEYNKVEIEKLQNSTDCFSSNPGGLIDSTLKPFVKDTAIQLIRTGPQATEDIGSKLEETATGIGKQYFDGLVTGIKCSVAKELTGIGQNLIGDLIGSIGLDLEGFSSPFDSLQTPSLLADLVSQGWLPSFQEINDAGGIDPSAWGLDPDIINTVTGNISDLDRILNDYNDYKASLEDSEE